MHLPDDYLDPISLEHKLINEDEDFWLRRGEKRVIQLFKDMSVRVPAYKDFLKKNHLDPDKINSVGDLKQVPSIDKYNYLREYPLEALCWDGEFKNKQWTIATTSGSTGEPFYFPREKDQDWQYAAMAELYLRCNFEIHKKSTLYIIAFPMGPWIGGVFTYQAIKYVAERGNYPLSVITTGINKKDVINAVRNLGDHFDQIIIGSYGPFLKDIVDDGINSGLDWKKYNLGFIFSAEVFTESFRDYIQEKTGFKNIYTSTLNHYGTVDLGTMAYETPVSILGRRSALLKEPLYKSLFGDITKLPTFAQYFPDQFYFEEEDGDLFCSAYSGLPLVRYDLKDHGGVKLFSQVNDIFSKNVVQLSQETQKAGIEKTVWKLPFVYVYERSDFSVSFYAFQIYPETIRKALSHKQLEKNVTGKFTLLVKFDEKQNQFLEVNVELKAHIKSSIDLQKNIQKIIVDQLAQDSSEYRKTLHEIPDRVIPQIIFWDYEDPTYFKPGIKQKWVKKT